MNTWGDNIKKDLKKEEMFGLASCSPGQGPMGGCYAGGNETWETKKQEIRRLAE